MTAEFRSVQTRMWREDDWFQDQPTDARLLFIYLFTNPSASVSGIYRLPLRTMAFESGLSVERVTELLTQFSAANKAHYEDGVIWVVKMRDNQLPAKNALSRQIMTHLATEIEKIPAGRLKNLYLEAYGYPIDTLSIPYGCTSTSTDTDTETSTSTSTGKTQQEDEDGDVLTCWKENMPDTLSKKGALPKATGDAVLSLVNTYGKTTVIRAIGEAAINNGHSLRYVQRILENWTVGPPAQGNGTIPAVNGFALSDIMGD